MEFCNYSFDYGMFWGMATILCMLYILLLFKNIELLPRVTFNPDIQETKYVRYMCPFVLAFSMIFCAPVAIYFGVKLTSPLCLSTSFLLNSSAAAVRNVLEHWFFHWRSGLTWLLALVDKARVHFAQDHFLCNAMFHVTSCSPCIVLSTLGWQRSPPFRYTVVVFGIWWYRGVHDVRAQPISLASGLCAALCWSFSFTGHLLLEMSVKYNLKENH